MHALKGAPASLGAWPLDRARQQAMARRAAAGATAAARAPPPPAWRLCARAGGPSAAPGGSPAATNQRQARAAVATPPPPPPVEAQQQQQQQQQQQHKGEREEEEAAAAAARHAAAPAAATAAPATQPPQGDPTPAQPSTWWSRLVAQVATRRFRAFAMLNAMTILLGLNWAVVKLASDAGLSGPALDPSTFTAFRFALATAVFSPWLVEGFRDRGVARAGAELGAWCAAGYVTQAIALSMTPASRASLLSTFTVLIVPVFAAGSGQKIKPLVWGCAAAAVLGTLLLEAGSAEPPNAGDAWAILSAAAFAGQLFRAEVLTSDLPPSSSLPLMAVSMATIAGVTAAVAGATDWRDAASTADALGNMAGAIGDVVQAGHPVGTGHAEGLLAAGELAFTAFLSTALALLLELVALKDVSSTEAALVYSLEPLVGASVSCLFLGERFGPTGVAGAAIVLASSVASQLVGAREREQEGGGNDGGDGGAASSSSSSSS